MAYELLKVNMMPEGPPWVSIGSHHRPGGYGQIKLTMSRTVARHLEADAGDRVEVYKGVDEHAGWVALVKGPDGFVAQRKNTGNLFCRFSCRFMGIDEYHKTTRVDGDAVVMTTGEDGLPWVYVELPKWARAEVAA